MPAFATETSDVNELKVAVQAYADEHRGRIYAPILHPEFAHFASHHGHDRFEALQDHVPGDARTMLDIGSHWGYFAHRFEDLGLQVTAAENNREYLYFLRSIRAVCGKRFEVWDRSVFELPAMQVDLVLALNIFHHFIKTEALHRQFVELLERLECRYMFLQPHRPEEGQMKGAYRNYAPHDFVAFVMQHCRLTGSKLVAKFQGRPVFLLSK